MPLKWHAVMGAPRRGGLQAPVALDVRGGLFSWLKMVYLLH
jgi:hypothetical protein